MPRLCSICKHPERAAIDEALFRNGVSFRNVAKQFEGVSVAALFRHKEHSPVAGQPVRKRAEPVASLPPKKQAYIEGRLAGKSKRRAALDAGYTESMADHATTKIETRDVRRAFAALIRGAIPAEEIARTIKAGLEATETKFFAHEGVVQDQREVPAWGERRQYATLAAEYGGYHAPDKSGRDQGGGVILILPPAEAKPAVGAKSSVIDAELEPPAEKASPALILPENGSDA